MNDLFKLSYISKYPPQIVSKELDEEIRIKLVNRLKENIDFRAMILVQYPFIEFPKKKD